MFRFSDWLKFPIEYNLLKTVRRINSKSLISNAIDWTQNMSCDKKNKYIHVHGICKWVGGGICFYDSVSTMILWCFTGDTSEILLLVWPLPSVLLVSCLQAAINVNGYNNGYNGQRKMREMKCTPIKHI